MRYTLELTPLGDKIKYRVKGKVYCGGYENKKSATYDYRDLLWRRVFGSLRKVKAFLKKNRKRYLTVTNNPLHLDACDSVK